LYRGEAYRYKGEYDLAIADYDALLRFDAGYSRVLTARGSAYSQKDDYDRAVKDYDEAIRLNP
jgi:tetratricopeptide (TPR) repeat protein